MSTMVPTLPPPRTVRPEAPKRPVRVTIMAEARPLAHNSNLLRIYTSSGPMVVDTRTAEVTVEYVTAARVWTDGDVVTTPHQVWTRSDGRWHAPSMYGTALAQDGDMDQSLACLEGWRVLRYLRGGDE